MGSFLDEPTIGLDIVVKEKIQQFLLWMNEEKKVTVILTTHNLDDIEKLCRRVIFIDQGKVLFDGSSEEMVRRFGDYRYVVVDSPDWDESSWNGLKVYYS
jgi:ABC-2 type transport system ATP-binding protein